MKKTLLFIAGLMLAISANAAFYVAGNGEQGNPWCDGKHWNPAGSEMVDNTITFKDVPAGTYEFKVTDGTWDFALNAYNMDAAQSTPGYEGTDNVKFTIASTADITISTDGQSIVLKSTVPFGKVVITSWTIVGVSDLMTTAWDLKSTDNVMTQNPNGTYSLVIKGVELLADYQTDDNKVMYDGYGYKVVANASWSINIFPAQGNQYLDVEEDGTYDVTFNWDPSGYLEAIAEKSTETAIEDVMADDAVVAAYDLTGKPVAADAKGVVILQYASGKAAKVVNY